MKLFTTVAGLGWNAELPSNRLRSAYGHYARGYFNASLALLRRGGDDTLVYPAVFSFRHGIELALKSLARDLHVVGEVERLGGPNHRLDEIWEKVREPIDYYSSNFYFDAHFDPGMKLTPLDVDEVIHHLNRSDPASMAFRYPISLDGQPYLGELPLLDMATFTETAKRVAGGMMIWVDWAAERSEGRLFDEWKKHQKDA
jgi:hypothetical protein